MGKTRVEVCLISGRGLQGSSTALFWKTQWFAVGWIDPKDKYCTKMEAPRNGNPVWGTKFSTELHNSQAPPTLQVEVYSRDPLFLREKLQGTASVVLKEFLANPKGNEESGSYQLRKKNSDKARGFVDVSVRVLGGGKEAQLHHPFSTYSSFPAGDGVVMLVDDERDVALAATTGSTSRDDYMLQEYNNRKGKGGPSPLPLAAHRVEENHNHNYWGAQPYSQPTPFPANFCNNSVGGPSYPPAAAISNYLNIPSRPLMPVPPSLLPSGHNYHLPLSDQYTGRRTSYINMPSSSSSGGSGFGMGAGIGAVGAGAFLFGDEFVSGAFDLLGA